MLRFKTIKEQLTGMANKETFMSIQHPNILFQDQDKKSFKPTYLSFIVPQLPLMNASW